MVPNYTFTLRNADDDKVYEQIRDTSMLAKEWIHKNPADVRDAAAWLIHHHVSPISQRKAITLQSALAEIIMRLALRGVPFRDYPRRWDEFVTDYTKHPSEKLRI